MTIDC